MKTTKVDLSEVKLSDVKLGPTTQRRIDRIRDPATRFEVELFARRIGLLMARERERAAQIVESHANTDPDRAIAAAAAEIRGGK